jgi:hypothetical protein
VATSPRLLTVRGSTVDASFACEGHFFSPGATATVGGCADPTEADALGEAVYVRSGADARWVTHSIHVVRLEHELNSVLTLFVLSAGLGLFRAPLNFRSQSGAGRENCRPRSPLLIFQGAPTAARIRKPCQG